MAKAGIGTANWSEYSMKGTVLSGFTAEELNDRLAAYADPHPQISFLGLAVGNQEFVNVFTGGNRTFNARFRNPNPPDIAQSQIAALMTHAVPGAFEEAMTITKQFTEQVVVKTAQDVGDLASDGFNEIKDAAFPIGFMLFGLALVLALWYAGPLLRGLAK